MTLVRDLKMNKVSHQILKKPNDLLMIFTDALYYCRMPKIKTKCMGTGTIRLQTFQKNTIKPS